MQLRNPGHRFPNQVVEFWMLEPAPGKSTNRVLLEISSIPGKCHEDDITIETGERHSYSDKYKSLTDAFYL